MSTFDTILPEIEKVLSSHKAALTAIGELIINRDLNGRVRLIAHASIENKPETQLLASAISTVLGNHGFSPEKMFLFENDLEKLRLGVPCYQPFIGIESLWVIDRLVSETDWSRVNEISEGAPRIVFYSIKGGVGRSTATAISAWHLAQQGKRVMALDLDLESPGLSSALLPESRRPVYGITDWLVEDLVDNGDIVFNDMMATSELSQDGDIFVVPAHGKVPCEYIQKLGRAWMPKVRGDRQRESWSKRLNRLLNQLEEQWKPDVILIDSRAGIDDVASACVTDLGARSIFLFALEGDQTWTGYRVIFDHWNRTGSAKVIRDRLQIVAGMIPSLEPAKYMEAITEKSWSLFTDQLYDAIPEGVASSDAFNFDCADQNAPHYPLAIRWHQGFAGMVSLHRGLDTMDYDMVRAVFGDFLKGLDLIIS